MSKNNKPKKVFELPDIDYSKVEGNPVLKPVVVETNDSEIKVEKKIAEVPPVIIEQETPQTKTVLKDVTTSDKSIAYSFNAMKDTNFSILQVRNMIELYNVNETKSRVVKLNSDSTEKLKLVSTVLGKKFSMEALINIIIKFGADVIYEDLKNTKELKEFMKNFKM